MNKSQTADSLKGGSLRYRIFSPLAALSPMGERPGGEGFINMFCNLK